MLCLEPWGKPIPTLCPSPFCSPSAPSPALLPSPSPSPYASLSQSSSPSPSPCPGSLCHHRHASHGTLGSTPTSLQPWVLPATRHAPRGDAKHGGPSKFNHGKVTDDLLPLCSTTRTKAPLQARLVAGGRPRQPQPQLMSLHSCLR